MTPANRHLKEIKMPISERQALALKKKFGPKLHAAGVADVMQFRAHELSWSELEKRKKAFVDLARAGLESLPEQATGDETREVEVVHEALMSLIDACEHEKDQRTELGSREARIAGGSARRPVPADGAERREFGAAEIAADHDAPEFGVALRPEQRMVDWAAAQRATRHPGLTAGAFLRAMVTGPKNDTERRALSEGTDSAGGFTVPDVLSSWLIDRLRAASVVSKAGARTIPLTSDQNYIAKLVSDPVPGWRGEAEGVDESDPSFTRVSLAPKSLAVLVKVSRELLEDSLNIETALIDALTKAMALEVDRMALFGSGTGNEPQGLTKMTGINAVAHGAALASYAPLVVARTKVLTANAPEPTAYIMHPREDGTITGLTATDGQPLQAPAKIAAIKQLATTSVPVNGGTGTNESSIITGYFPHLLLGIRSSLRIEVLRERYADTLQYGFIAHLRATVAAEQTSSFAHVTCIKPTA